MTTTTKGFAKTTATGISAAVAAYTMNRKGFAKTTATGVTAVLAAYVAAQPAVSGDVFSAEEVLELGQAAAVEYTEKMFAGPAMSDDEWASL